MPGWLKFGRTGLLLAGLALAAMAVVGMFSGTELYLRLLAAILLAGALLIVGLAVFLRRLEVFDLILRHLEYLTQASEYNARLLREITEVMRAIEEAELESGGDGKQKKKSGEAQRAKEDQEIEKAVRQFEI